MDECLARPDYLYIYTVIQSPRGFFLQLRRHASSTVYSEPRCPTFDSTSANESTGHCTDAAPVDARATSRTSVTCGRNVSCARNSNPRSGAQPLDDRRQLRRHVPRCQADQARASPELDRVKMQQKVDTECQLLRRLRSFEHVSNALCRDGAEENERDVQIAGGDRAPKGRVRLRGGGQLLPDGISGP